MAICQLPHSLSNYFQIVYSLGSNLTGFECIVQLPGKKLRLAANLSSMAEFTNIQSLFFMERLGRKQKTCLSADGFIPPLVSEC